MVRLAFDLSKYELRRLQKLPTLKSCDHDWLKTENAVSRALEAQAPSLADELFNLFWHAISNGLCESRIRCHSGEHLFSIGQAGLCKSTQAFDVLIRCDPFQGSAQTALQRRLKREARSLRAHGHQFWSQLTNAPELVHRPLGQDPSTLHCP